MRKIGDRNRFSTIDGRYKRLGKNTILVFLGGAGSKLIGFLMLPFYTKYLSTAEYGVSDLIGTYSSILVSFVSCCIADAIFVFPKEADKDGRTKYFSSGVIFLFFSFLLFFLVSWLLSALNNSGNIEGTFIERIWWIYLFTVTAYLQSYTQQFTRSIDKMGVYSMTGVVHTLAVAIMSIVLIPQYGLTGFLSASVLSCVVSAVFSFTASGSYNYFSIKSFDFSYLKELLKFGIPLIPNGVMWWLVNGISRPILEKTVGLDAIGIYSVAGKFPGILNMLFTLFMSAWGVSMIEEFHKPGFNAFFNKSIKMLTLFTLLGGSSIVVCSKIIIRIFAAPNYFEAWQYVPLLTLSVVLQNMSGLIGGVFMAQKKSKYFFYSSIWGAVTSLFFSFLLINIWGLFGAAISAALSFVVMIVVRIKYAWPHINELDLKYLSLMFFLYLFLITMVTINISGVITVIVFVLVVALMLLISRKELIPLLKILKIVK